MLNRNKFQFFSLSLIVHCCAFIFFSFSITLITPPLILPKAVIKSYLYSAPKKQLTNNTDTKTEKLSELKINMPSSTLDHRAILNKQLTEHNKNNKTLGILDTPQKQLTEIKTKQLTLSPQQQLAQLKHAIEYDTRSAPLQSNNNAQPSIFNSTPQLVPHSTKNSSNINTMKENTTRYAPNLSIIKNSDGSCTIEEDLSNLGTDVIARQHFQCGKTKLEKIFKQHMNEVNKRINY